MRLIYNSMLEVLGLSAQGILTEACEVNAKHSMPDWNKLAGPSCFPKFILTVKPLDKNVECSHYIGVWVCAGNNFAP